MLKLLYAKNYALIREIRVEFGPGLNVITGETGAGKSILLGALGGILGDKLGKEIIRSGTDKCLLEAEFENCSSDELLGLFQQNGIEPDDTGILIRREISANGRSRCFVNDSPVPLTVLVETGDLLVDLHGQHQHQLLLQARRHIEYLDDIGSVAGLLEMVQSTFAELVSAQKQLNDLLQKQRQLVQSRDVLQFQIKEIESINPKENEDVELENEERILGNSELLFERCNALLQDLYEKEGSVSELLRRGEETLSALGDIDSQFNLMKKECLDARIIVEELSNSLQSYLEGIVFDPGRLESIRQRLAALAGLKKKYHGTIDAILQHISRARQEFAMIETLDDKIVDQRNEIENKRLKLKELAVELSSQRRAYGEKLSFAVSEQLAQLGMPHARFRIDQTSRPASGDNYVHVNSEQIEVNSKGIDRIEFLISTNPGESLKPLAKVASGGEISRIMLALKSLLAEVDKIPVLVFDEIDIGISGRIAQAVGISLRKLANTHQVICITHLPQIASMAQHHFLVEKRVERQATQTSIRELFREERTRQVAQLFGGETVTEAHLQSASQLIKESEKLVH